MRLFSTVLKREGDRFYLVTPVEKLGILVDDAPFLATGLEVEGQGPDQVLAFTTNVGDRVILGPENGLSYRAAPGGEDMAPYIHVRGGLEAKVARSVYYDLAELGEVRGEGDAAQFGVTSKGVFFPMESATSVFGAA